MGNLAKPILRMQLQGFFLILFSLFAGTLAAQITDTAWQNFNTGNSALPDNFVSDIEVTADGTVWVATWGGGLVKIKDDQWTLYNADNSGLPSNLINHMSFDRNGVLWLATDGDITRFDGVNWKVIRLPAKENIALTIEADPLGRIWVGTYDQGLYRYDGRQLKKMWGGYKSMDYGVNDILFDREGTAWLATRIGLLQYKDESWTLYDTTHPELSANVYYQLAMDSKGDVWAATYPPGNYARWNGDDWAMYQEPRPSATADKDFPGNYIYAMYITDGDEILGGSQYHGALALFDGDDMEEIATPLSPKDMGVSSLEMDKEGNIWVGSWKRGFFFLKNPEQQVTEGLIDSFEQELFLDRKIKKQRDLTVNSPKVELWVYDNRKVDGDTVSVSLNGEWVIRNRLITQTPIKVDIRLKRDFDNHLILYAENLGRRPPNTAAIAIVDKSKEHRFTLRSDLDKSGTVIVRYKPEP